MQSRKTENEKRSFTCREFAKKKNDASKDDNHTNKKEDGNKKFYQVTLN